MNSSSTSHKKTRQKTFLCTESETQIKSKQGNTNANNMLLNWRSSTSGMELKFLFCEEFEIRYWDTTAIQIQIIFSKKSIRMKNKSPWSGTTSQLKNNQPTDQPTKNSPAKIVTRWKLQLIPPVKGQRPEPLSHKLQFIIPTTGCQLQENCLPVQVCGRSLNAIFCDSLWNTRTRDVMEIMSPFLITSSIDFSRNICRRL